MGSYVFRWDDPSASEVRVAGTFNDWPHIEKLERIGNSFEKKIYFQNPNEMIYYRFVVDGVWAPDPTAPLVFHHDRRVNVIVPSQITNENVHAAHINSSLPLSSSTASVQERKSVQASYRYKGFTDDHEVRIITLHCSSQFSDIVCGLEHVSLINPGSYVALSYYWGDSTMKKTIWLDGFCVNVTENLYSALRQVSKFKASSGKGHYIRLWVDALCINQEDEKERSMQVRIMRHIYSKSQEVISCVRDLSSGRRHPVSLSAEFVANLIKGRFVGQSERLSSEEDSWGALDRFFLLPYWTRVWVIQEIAVASSVTILYGDIPIPWDDVAATLTSWKNSPAMVLIHKQGYSNAIHLAEFRTRFRIARQPIRLSDALHWSRRTQATDPRDKIFALLGLCHDGPTFVPLPNYEQSLEAIIFDMSKNMMAWDRTLDLMCIRGIDATKEEILNPSWLPNLPNVWSGTLTILESRILEERRTYDFNPVLDGPTEHSIKVNGIFCGKIEALSSVMSPHNKDKSAQPARAPWILSTSTLRKQDPRLQKGSSSDIATRDAISRALTMDLLPPEFSIGSARSCFSTLWTPEGRGAIHNLALIEWIDRNAWFKVGRWTLREWSQLELAVPLSSRSFISSSAHSMSELELYLQTLERVLGSGMRLIVLENEKVGIAHPSVDVSDYIYWVRGCSQPVALASEKLSDGSVVYRVKGAVHLLYLHKPGELEAYRNFVIGKAFDLYPARLFNLLGAPVEDLILI